LLDTKVGQGARLLRVWSDLQADGIGLLDMPNAMTTDGVTVRSFVDGWASGDARFSTVGP
jgi:hypothetical protein